MGLEVTGIVILNTQGLPACNKKLVAMHVFSAVDESSGRRLMTSEKNKKFFLLYVIFILLHPIAVTAVTSPF
jgi:hypothetical protein